MPAQGFAARQSGRVDALLSLLPHPSIRCCCCPLTNPEVREPGVLADRVLGRGPGGWAERASAALNKLPAQWHVCNPLNSQQKLFISS